MHFHAPTRQWAGPHSRSYETDLRKRPATLAFLQSAWERPDLKLADRLDAVAYRGAEQAIKLYPFPETFLCFTLEEWPYDQRQSPPAGIQMEKGDGRLRVCSTTRGRTLGMDVPIKPGSFLKMNDSFRSGLA